MNVSRHRFRHRRFEIPQPGFQWIWDDDHDVWVILDGEIPFTRALSDGTREEVIDDVIGDDYHTMHNCAHHKRVYFFGNDRIGPEFKSHVEWCDGTTLLSKSHVAPDNYVYECTRQWLPPEGLTVGLVDSLFAKQGLPSFIDLHRDSDPSQGFSIWMLAVDLAQLPALVLQLLKAPGMLLRSRLSARELANTNLLVQFGLLATISDFREFFRICSTWKDSYDALRASQDQVHTRRLPVTSINPDWLPKGSIIDGIPITGLTGSLNAQAITTYSAEHRRTIKYRVTCPELTGWLARVCQFIEAFGLLNPAAAWDNVPWSFVVDWFYPFGQWIQRHRPKVFPLDIVIRDYCESIKAESSIRLGAKHLEGLPIGGPHTALPVFTPFAQISERVFVRKRFKPPTSIVELPKLRSPVLSVRRISIAASLIAQKLPRSIVR